MVARNPWIKVKEAARYEQVVLRHTRSVKGAPMC
jgi:hypothetical protein